MTRGTTVDPLDLWSEVFRALLFPDTTALLADATMVVGTVWRDPEDLVVLLHALPEAAVWLRRAVLVGLGALGVAPEPRGWLDQPHVFSGGLLGTVMAVGTESTAVANGGDPAEWVAVSFETIAAQTTVQAHQRQIEDAAELARAGIWLEAAAPGAANMH